MLPKLSKSLYFSLLLLIAAVALQAAYSARTRRPPSAFPAKMIAAKLPNSLPGFNVRDEPIATTLEMKAAVEKMLDYDEGIFRIYERGDLRVSVYIAWWKPGKSLPRMVASHTPDVCWVASGWEKKSLSAGQVSDTQAAILHNGLMPAEVRTFISKGHTEHVVFWHLVGGEVFTYNTAGLPPWWAWIADFWRFGSTNYLDQMFVRVSSNQPIDYIWEQAYIAPLRDSLATLGLASH
jgi:hypothetical protein